MFGSAQAQDLSVMPPSKCETCVLLSRELQASIEKGGRGRKRSESLLLDSLDGVCGVLGGMRLHKEKQGVDRFARSESDTMRTLKQLKERGVKVELGMPYEMWDQPAAEVALLKRSCEQLLSEWEETVEEWYWTEEQGEKRSRLEDVLCGGLLPPSERSCLEGAGKEEREEL